MDKTTMEAQAIGLLGDAMAGGMTYAVERMERHEQARAVNSSRLPKPGPTREAWEALGFTFGADVDDLFCEATMPDGWTVKATGHAMWNDILDHKGRKRGQFFYKGAFYDRDAFMSSPERRYTVRRDYSDDLPDDQMRALVFDCGTEIFRSKTLVVECGGDEKPWQARERVEASVIAECVAWLTERYPDHRNPAAYWD